jgi:glycosyltransferase involved in cell wall biosynthesis
MLEASKKSELLSVFPHIQIANGIDSEVFNILDKKSVRDSLGLPLDKSIFLFVSESLDNKRKQFNVLLDAFSQMKRTDSMLVAVGVIPSDRKSNIHYIGTVKDETKMVELYNAADAFILPSAEDNLPNVMLESLMCGTPVIATPVGGMNEVIEHGVNGYLASEDNAIALKKVLDYFLDTQHTFDREVIRKVAIEKFELKQQAEAYKNLYKAIVSKLN